MLLVAYLRQPDVRHRKAPSGTLTCAGAPDPRPRRPDLVRVRTRGGCAACDVGRGVPSASVVKAMLLVAYLREPDVRGPPPAGGRARASRPDDPPLRQRRGVAGLQHRRHRRARAARAPRAHAPLPRHPPVGPVDDRRRGPDALLPPHRPPRAPAAPPLRDAAARLDRARAAMGDRPRAPAGLGALLQGRLGLRHRLGGPPGGPAAPRTPPPVGGDPDHLEPEPRVRQRDAARSGGAAAARPAGRSSRPR